LSERRAGYRHPDGNHPCTDDRRRTGHSAAASTSWITLNTYTLTAVFVGIVVLLAAWLPVYLRDRPLSLPMVLIAIGAATFGIVPGLGDVDPRQHLEVTEHVTELAVLISLLGAGLALDRVPGWRTWSSAWRLLGVAMPITIGAMFLAGWAAGLAPATALLFGAVVAPTDPVLAADVHVGEPTVEGDRVEREDEVRFSLTSEAGLNDGLAYPFVLAAIAIAIAAEGPNGGDWFTHWAWSDLVLRVLVGAIAGWSAGRILARVMFDPPGRLVGLAQATQGFVAVGAILFTYGITEIAHGYGFLAVFIAAVTLRHSRREDSYHAVMHDFTAQLEQLLSVALLVLLGGALVTGLLSHLTWRGVVGGLLLIFVVRPLAGRLALVGSATSRGERRAIAFFGIRGIGSIYYLAVAVQATRFVGEDEVWSATAFTILASVFIHGITATPVMRALDRRRVRRGRLVANDLVSHELSGSTRQR
jgi:NhaP-type Na+/H+ or K+/H+ antiporter